MRIPAGSPFSWLLGVHSTAVYCGDVGSVAILFPIMEALVEQYTSNIRYQDVELLWGAADPRIWPISESGLIFLNPLPKTLDARLRTKWNRTTVDILIPYAALEPDLCQDISASNQCHPVLLQVLKPVVTSGNGNCMFNALSLTLAGNEHLSAVLRLLCVYGLVKHKDTMLRAITRGWGSSRANDMYSRDLYIAVTNGEWGTDDHLFVMSLALNRPIFLFNTFYFTDSDTNQVTLSLSDVIDISSLIQHFSFHDVGTRTHVLYCSNAQADLLQGSDLMSLPNFPLCLCHISNYHWVGMLLQDASVSSLIPIPYTRVLRE